MESGEALAQLLPPVIGFLLPLETACLHTRRCLPLESACLTHQEVFATGDYLPNNQELCSCLSSLFFWVLKFKMLYFSSWPKAAGT